MSILNNLLQNLMHGLTRALSAALLVSATYLVSTHNVLAENEILSRHEVAFTGSLGDEFTLIKQAVIEESGGQPGDWVPTFDSIIGRIHSDLFPDTVETVLKQQVNGRWQFSYWGDDVHADITDPAWDDLHAVLEPLWVAYVHGEYETSVDAHSFCTPAACRASWGYFGTFAVAHEGEGHRYFGGEQGEVQTYFSAHAPGMSLRPMARPTEDLRVAFGF